MLTQLRTPQALVFATIQPVIFVLLFRYAFGGAIHVPGTNYVDFLMPGIFAQTVGRITDRGITYYADPACRQPGQVYASKNGRRGLYFRDPDGHLMEILTPVKETA